MLRLAIPGYRLPRDVLDREIAALVDDNVTLRMGVTLGQQITVDGLLDDGFSAVFLALGASRASRCASAARRPSGVHPSLEFLGAHNLKGASLARGRVGVIGGGNSAIDAARVALRQRAWRRSRSSTAERARRCRPSPRRSTPPSRRGCAQDAALAVSVKSEGGELTALECVENELGPADQSGRRRPVPIDGLRAPRAAGHADRGRERAAAGRVAGPRRDQRPRGGLDRVDPQTLATSRTGVFAGGDVVTGPNTVVDAIAAGKRAAAMIDRYLEGEKLERLAGSAGLSPYVERTTARHERATTEAGGYAAPRCRTCRRPSGGRISPRPSWRSPKSAPGGRPVAVCAATSTSSIAPCRLEAANAPHAVVLPHGAGGSVNRTAARIRSPIPPGGPSRSHELRVMPRGADLRREQRCHAYSHNAGDEH